MSKYFSPMDAVDLPPCKPTPEYPNGRIPCWHRGDDGSLTYEVDDRSGFVVRTAQVADGFRVQCSREFGADWLDCLEQPFPDEPSAYRALCKVVASTKRMPVGRREIGVVGVDSGRFRIADPCYDEAAAERCGVTILLSSEGGYPVY
jgi:hypothetical protein